MIDNTNFKENKVEQNVIVNIPNTTVAIEKLIDKLPSFTPKDESKDEFGTVVKDIKDEFQILKELIVSKTFPAKIDLLCSQ